MPESPQENPDTTHHINGNGSRKTENEAADRPVQQKPRKRNVSENSEVSIDDAEDYIPTPPDGGWGWVIVAASMFSNLIVDGIGYTFGVFLTEFVEVFDAPKSKISLVGSLLCGTYLFAGPFVSAMTNKFGCRKVVITGSIIATISFLVASLSPTADMLIMTYGVAGGFGLGMIYLPSIVSVGYYFEKRRALATGIAVCGSGLGTFIFPPLSEVLLSEFSWRGSLVIIAGIILQGCICGCLMRPLEAKPPPKKIREKNLMDRMTESKQKNKTRSVSECVSLSTNTGDTNAMEKLLEAKLHREKNLQDNESNTSYPSVAFIKRLDSVGGEEGKPDARYRHKTSVSSSLVETTSTAEQKSPESPSSIAPNIIIELDSQRKSKDRKGSSDVTDGTEGDGIDKKPRLSISNGKPPNSEHAPLLEVPSLAYGNSAVRGGNAGGSRTNLNNLHHSLRSLHVSKKDLARPLYRKDIFYSGSIMNISQYQSQPDMKSYITSVTTIPGEMDFVDSPSPSSKCINFCCACIPRSARDVLSEMIDVSLFKDISFMLICLGNIFAFLGFFVPFMFLVDRAVSMGIEKTKASLIISVIGVTNTIGRIMIGFVADLPSADSLVMSYSSIALCAVATALFPFCTTFPLLLADAAFFGLCVAAFVSLSSIVICDRMGLEKLTNGFGLLCMVRGLAGMAGPPLAGYMYDSSNSYDLSFFVGGALLMAGAVCHIFLHLPCLQTKVPNRKNNEMVLEEIPEMTMGSKPEIITVDELLKLDTNTRNLNV